MKCSFGWLHPEYNLMSWALSCLSLRRHYDEVALYTDSVGKHVLIDLLHLPYTEVNVVFDGFKCLPHHWALAKVHTYSLQEKPFIHVDGDVYAAQPFSVKGISSQLFVQNKEQSTGFYGKMVERILSCPGLVVPETVQNAVKEGSVPSYNMGVFGGCGISDIHSYCDFVLRFVNGNSLNDTKSPNSSISCNVFMEQMLFAVFADDNNLPVSYVDERQIRDDGYTVADFCDLDSYDDGGYYHILGGHKQNNTVANMLERCVLRNAPHHYMLVKGLFPSRNIRFIDTDAELIGNLFTDSSLEDYMSAFDAFQNKWRFLGKDELLEQERTSAEYVRSLVKKHPLGKQPLVLNPRLQIFDVPQDNKRMIDKLKERLKCDARQPVHYVAFTPCLSGSGVRETPLVDSDMMMLSILSERAMPYDGFVSESVRQVLQADATADWAVGYMEGQLKNLIENMTIVLT